MILDLTLRALFLVVENMPKSRTFLYDTFFGDIFFLYFFFLFIRNL